MNAHYTPPELTHVSGTHKGEEAALHGPEPGRGGKKFYRSARDSTGLNADKRQPILPEMPNIPPA